MKTDFWPLNKGPYNDIDSGIKLNEIRKLGGKWKPENYPQGRLARVSYGYGKHRPRILVEVTNTKACKVIELLPHEQKAVRACYPGIAGDEMMLVIEFKKLGYEEEINICTK